MHNTSAGVCVLHIITRQNATSVWSHVHMWFWSCVQSHACVWCLLETQALITSQLLMFASVVVHVVHNRRLSDTPSLIVSSSECTYGAKPCVSLRFCWISARYLFPKLKHMSLHRGITFIEVLQHGNNAWGGCQIQHMQSCQLIVCGAVHICVRQMCRLSCL